MTTTDAMQVLRVNRVYVLRLVERGALVPSVVGARGVASYEFEPGEVERVAELIRTYNAARTALGLTVMAAS